MSKGTDADDVISIRRSAFLDYELMVRAFARHCAWTSMELSWLAVRLYAVDFRIDNEEKDKPLTEKHKEQFIVDWKNKLDKTLTDDNLMKWSQGQFSGEFNSDNLYAGISIDDRSLILTLMEDCLFLGESMKSSPNFGLRPEAIEKYFTITNEHAMTTFRQGNICLGYWNMKLRSISSGRIGKKKIVAKRAKETKEKFLEKGAIRGNELEIDIVSREEAHCLVHGNNPAVNVASSTKTKYEKKVAEMLTEEMDKEIRIRITK